jgi:hypothetical protein
MKYEKDLTKYKFGKLTPIELVGIGTNYQKLWKCKCDCGNFKVILRNSLIRGNTKSCGCFVKEKKPREKILNHTCPNCKNKVYIKPSRLKRCNVVFCSMPCRTEYYHQYKRLMPTYKGRDEYRKFFDEKCTRMRMSSRKRGIHFSNEMSGELLYDLWLKQEGKCHYTQIAMSIKKEDHLKLVSVDRVDNSRGYEKDNIVLCTYIFNSFKFSFKKEEILNFITELKQIK